MPLHTILGANGAVGRALSRELTASGVRLRQVGRHPRCEFPSDEIVVTDLTNAASTVTAIAGSNVVYLVAGVPYTTAAWQADWPRIMANVIEGCERSGAALVFFDNVYAYGPCTGVMTEATPFDPCSHKGEVRARIATTLLDAIRTQRVTAMIVRSPDFYYPREPGRTTAMLNAIVFDRLRAGKAPQWLGNPDAPHSFSYTPDLGRSLALLGTSTAAFGQTWHALTTPEEQSGRDLVRLASDIAGRAARLQTAPRWMIRAMGLLQPSLREQVEMLYQFEQPYRFSSSKLSDAFGVSATPYGGAFREVWAHDVRGSAQAARGPARVGAAPVDDS